MLHGTEAERAGVALDRVERPEDVVDERPIVRRLFELQERRFDRAEMIERFGREHPRDFRVALQRGDVVFDLVVGAPGLPLRFEAGADRCGVLGAQCRQARGGVGEAGFRQRGGEAINRLPHGGRRRIDDDVARQSRELLLEGVEQSCAVGIHHRRSTEAVV
jgi:hypothetical protein